MFVDDLKIYEDSAAELRSTLEVAEGFLVAVGMTLGVRKCAVAHLRAGRVRSQGGVETERSTINEISRGDSYRYLGIDQVFGPRSRETKDRVVKEYLRRVHLVWSSPLPAGEKVRAHNAWAIAVLRYHMAPVTWGMRELEKLDARTRALLAQEGAHSPLASIERLYLPRDGGGRGLISVVRM